MELSNRKEAIRHGSAQLLNRKLLNQFWNLQPSSELSLLHPNSVLAQGFISSHIQL